MMESRLLFYSDLICLLHWGKQMIMSPYREFHFLFDVQINSLPRFIYFCHCWSGWFKKKKTTLLCCFPMSCPSPLGREGKPVKYLHSFKNWRTLNYKCPLETRVHYSEMDELINQTKLNNREEDMGLFLFLIICLRDEDSPFVNFVNKTPKCHLLSACLPHLMEHT